MFLCVCWVLFGGGWFVCVWSCWYLFSIVYCEESDGSSGRIS